jgi:hypothetical protein
MNIATEKTQKRFIDTPHLLIGNLMTGNGGDCRTKSGLKAAQLTPNPTWFEIGFFEIEKHDVSLATDRKTRRSLKMAQKQRVFHIGTWFPTGGCLLRMMQSEDRLAQKIDHFS